MVDNLTKNWKGIKLIGMLSFLMLFSPVFSRGDTNLNNNTYSTVTDGDSGEPLIGVNVLVKGTSKGTITDLDGYYAIEASSGETLVFSYTGYKDLEVAITNQSIVDLGLSEDVAQLDEVVVIGYGTQKKSSITGSVSKVVNESLDQIAVPRIDDALIGQVSGVNIQTTSAEAGD